MFTHYILARIIGDIALFFGLFFLPWWLVAVAGVVFLFIYNDYIEIIILGALIDVLFSPYAYTMSVSSLLYTSTGALLYIISPFLKRRLRFYNQSS